ncbi:thioredoxin domain-containing protein [Parvularcula lutaonensis]|uniref:Thioredoxin domain-containing protein n=1 Tax=Parvularcula lutaonensis TaxID=491923 RepID=A0ABV7MC26_9PROT|nr:hypothetical protein [Parvularcula lutaonensis]GGY37090.1 hypothetical protein GCM10007148_01600 [Parvularcula lutaonensis]
MGRLQTVLRAKTAKAVILLLVWLGLATPALATNPVPDSALPELETHIVNGPWTSHIDRPRNGTALYMYHWRHCPYCRAFMESEKQALLSAGVDIRLLPFPANSDSADELAYVAHRRSLALWQDFDAGRPLGAPSAQSDQALIDAFNAMIASVTFARSVLQAQGQFAGTPLFVYQDKDGQWFAVAGYSEEVFAPVRTALLERATASKTVEADTGASVVIPGCDALIDWAEAAGIRDANITGAQIAGGARPGGHLLWGLRDEQLEPVFRATLDKWTRGDVARLKAAALPCLAAQYETYRAAQARFHASGGRLDRSVFQAPADRHRNASLFLNNMLHMDRPVRDQFHFDAVMANQIALHARDLALRRAESAQ